MHGKRDRNRRFPTHLYTTTDTDNPHIRFHTTRRNPFCIRQPSQPSPPQQQQQDDDGIDPIFSADEENSTRTSFAHETAPRRLKSASSSRHASTTGTATARNFPLFRTFHNHTVHNHQNSQVNLENILQNSVLNSPISVSGPFSSSSSSTSTSTATAPTSSNTHPHPHSPSHSRMPPVVKSRTPGLRPSLSGSSTTPVISTYAMHVVIIGGSFTGLSIAVTLSRDPPKHHTAITLIEPKSYLEIPWLSLHALFSSSVTQNVVPLDKILGGCTGVNHTKGYVVCISDDTVTLADGNVIPFDVLLVATGCERYRCPVLTPGVIEASTVRTKTEEQLENKDGLRINNESSCCTTVEQQSVKIESKSDNHDDADVATTDNDDNDDNDVVKVMNARRQTLRNFGDKILLASVILIIGGGHLSSDLAAEIASNCGSRVRIILVDPRVALAPLQSRAFNARLEKRLVSLGVEIHLNETPRFNHQTNAYSLRRNPRPVVPDIVLSPDATRPTTGPGLFMGSQQQQKHQTKEGWIRTDNYGRVTDLRGNVFAAGDCTEWGSKSAEHALGNRFIYAHNIRHTVDAFATMKPLAAIDGKLKKINMKERNVHHHPHPQLSHLNFVVGGRGGGGNEDDGAEVEGREYRKGSCDGKVGYGLGMERDRDRHGSGNGNGPFGISLPIVWTRNRNSYLEKAKKDIGW